MAREQLEEKDADAIDIFPLGEITCVGRFWWVDFTRAFRLQGLLP